MLTNKNTAIIVSVIALAIVIAYFAFYQPYENQIAYQRNVQCSDLVAKYVANDKLTFQQLGVSNNNPLENWWNSSSHFSRSLNTCLGDIAYTQTNLSAATKPNGVDQYIDSSIVDVVSNKILVESDVDRNIAHDGSTTYTVLKGVSPSQFKQEETTLMSE